MDIYKTNYKPTDYVRSSQGQDVPAELAGEMKDVLGIELKSMALYMQAAYAIAKNTHSVNYLGHSKDMQCQLICQGISEMRHAEILGKTLARAGSSPQLKTGDFGSAKSYRELFDMLLQVERTGINSLSEIVGITNDKETKLALLNQLKEEESHLEMIKQMSQVVENAGLMDTLLPLPQGSGPVVYDINILLEAFELEIHSIVTLIYASIYLGADMSLAPRLRALSIESMKHLNKIAQDIITLGGRPVVTHESLNKGPVLDDATQVIKHGIESRKRKIEQYSQFAQTLKSQGAAKTLSDISTKEKESIKSLENIANSLATVGPIH